MENILDSLWRDIYLRTCVLYHIAVTWRDNRSNLDEFSERIHRLGVG